MKSKWFKKDNDWLMTGSGAAIEKWSVERAHTAPAGKPGWYVSAGPHTAQWEGPFKTAALAREHASNVMLI